MMKFFKKLFKSKKGKDSESVRENQGPKAKIESNNSSKVEIDGILTDEYFDSRYKEDNIDTSILEGTLKMIEGYFIANKIKPIIKEPINHPKNLDQTVDDGFGFVLYCKALNMEEDYALGILAMAFNDFMIKNHGFKLYQDSQPEYPLRNMTLKYDKNKAKLSLYPIEYTAKVLRYEANFEELYNRINDALKNMPTSDEFINRMTSEKN